MIVKLICNSERPVVAVNGVFRFFPKADLGKKVGFFGWSVKDLTANSNPRLIAVTQDSATTLESRGSRTCPAYLTVI